MPDIAVHVTRAGHLEQNLARYQRALPGALTSAGMVVVTRTQRIHVMFRPIGWATGHIVRSYTVGPPQVFGPWVVVKVGSTMGYAFWAHFGRRAGKWPPREDIRDWVREKHLSGSYAIVGQKPGAYPRYKRQGGRKQQATEDDRAAFLIARKIGEHGTKGFPALVVAFRQSREAAISAFMRGLTWQLAQQQFGAV